MLRPPLPPIGPNGLPLVTHCTQNLATAVDDLPVDVLLPISEAIVEEDAYKIREIFPMTLSGQTNERVRLALVSRRWKDIVYNSPSLWRILSFDLRSPLDSTQLKFDRLLSLAKGSAVDLLLKKYS